MSDIDEWLTACVDQDEQDIRSGFYVASLGRWNRHGYQATEGNNDVSLGIDRALAECKAKREIVRQARMSGVPLEPVVGDVITFEAGTLATLAVIYADRPGYQEAWRI